MLNYFPAMYTKQMAGASTQCGHQLSGSIVLHLQDIYDGAQMAPRCIAFDCSSSNFRLSDVVSRPNLHSQRQALYFGWIYSLYVYFSVGWYAHVLNVIAVDLSTVGALCLDILLAAIRALLICPQVELLTYISIVCICILRSRTGIDYLDRFLNRIVVFLWSCSIPPVLLMIPAVVIYHAVQNRLGSVWCGVCLAMSAKLYCHSLMRSLNSRDRLKGQLQQDREVFNSSEARKGGEEDPEELHYSHESGTRTANHTRNSLEDGAPSRFSSQVRFRMI
jgi:hypothetical protein